MSLLVYFDTNVFDNLLKKTGGVTEADESRLRAAVSSRRLAIVVSHVNIRETLAALRSNPEIARSQFGLIESLVLWDRFVKFHSTILEADIRHFAFNGERANTPFEEDRQAAHIRSMVQRIRDGRIGLPEFEAAIGEDRDQKAAFLKSVKKSRAETACELEELRKRGEIPSFEEFFEDGSKEHVLVFIESFGVSKECERRGLDNLLRIPSIRAHIGLAMSFMYGIAAEGIAPRRSDSRDLHHAVCSAAAADIFVTHDKDLAFLLRRVPIKGFRVMMLYELLEHTRLR